MTIKSCLIAAKPEDILCFLGRVLETLEFQFLNLILSVILALEVKVPTIIWFLPLQTLLLATCIKMGSITHGFMILAILHWKS